MNKKDTKGHDWAFVHGWSPAVLNLFDGRDAIARKAPRIECSQTLFPENDPTVGKYTMEQMGGGTDSLDSQGALCKHVLYQSLNCEIPCLM